MIAKDVETEAVLQAIRQCGETIAQLAAALRDEGALGDDGPEVNHVVLELVREAGVIFSGYNTMTTYEEEVQWVASMQAWLQQAAPFLKSGS